MVRQGDANGNGLTGGQTTACASWPQSPAFLVESDLNVSGDRDFMVRNVYMAIPGADEWVVFRNPAGDASSIMPVDFDRESFIGQLFAWSFDRNFFVDVALDQDWYDEVT